MSHPYIKLENTELWHAVERAISMLEADGYLDIAKPPESAVLSATGRAQGADRAQLEALQNVDVRVASLDGNALGLASKTTNVIWLDRDAAGYGWSIVAGVPQPGTVDLLSTLTHEFGHMLGLDHGVLGSTLVPGQRFLPSFQTVNPAAHVARIDEAFTGLGYQPLLPDPGRAWHTPIAERSNLDMIVTEVADTPDRVDILLPLPTSKVTKVFSGEARTAQIPDELDLILGEEMNLQIDAATGELLVKNL